MQVMAVLLEKINFLPISDLKTCIISLLKQCINALFAPKGFTMMKPMWQYQQSIIGTPETSRSR